MIFDKILLGTYIGIGYCIMLSDLNRHPDLCSKRLYFRLFMCKLSSLSEDEKDKILNFCLEAGAEDVDFGLDTDEHFVIQCNPHELQTFALKIRSMGLVVSEFESRYTEIRFHYFNRYHKIRGIIEIYG